jgi:hypothetical protein
MSDYVDRIQILLASLGFRQRVFLQRALTVMRNIIFNRTAEMSLSIGSCELRRYRDPRNRLLSKAITGGRRSWWHRVFRGRKLKELREGQHEEQRLVAALLLDRVMQDVNVSVCELSTDHKTEDLEDPVRIVSIYSTSM